MRLLEVEDLEARYDFLQVLWGVSIGVDRGEFVALLGPNGAGKSTTLRAITGLLPVMNGDVRVAGDSIVGRAPEDISRRGVALVSETLNLFPEMTIAENLVLGAYTLRDRRERRKQLDYVFGLLPALARRPAQLAGTLSGGERKMLAIGRALMGMPPLLLVDEPSLGLAPKVTATVLETLAALRSEGHAILLVEQNVPLTLELVDRGYVLEAGNIVLHGAATELAEDRYVQDAYMGV